MTCCTPKNFDRDAFRKLFTERFPAVNRSLPRMDDVIEQWLNSGWPMFCEGNTVAFCAPVGNTCYFDKEKPARVIISGFCVAPQAGLQYIRSSLLLGENAQNLKAQHTFNTPTMIRGICRIIDDYKISAKFNLEDALETFLKAKTGEIPLLLTQALCPIIVDGSSKAKNVWRALISSQSLRCFISHSLNRWWRTINNYSDKETRILLMGYRRRGRSELNKLLCYSSLDGDTVLITGVDQESRSLFFKLHEEFNERFSFIRHAAWYARNRL